VTNYVFAVRMACAVHVIVPNQQEFIIFGGVLTMYPVWRTFHVTSQACKSGCLVPQWLKHWSTDLKVLVLASLG